MKMLPMLTLSLALSLRLPLRPPVQVQQAMFQQIFLLDQIKLSATKYKIAATLKGKISSHIFSRH